MERAFRSQQGSPWQIPQNVDPENSPSAGKVFLTPAAVLATSSYQAELRCIHINRYVVSVQMHAC